MEKRFILHWHCLYIMLFKDLRGIPYSIKGSLGGGGGGGGEGGGGDGRGQPANGWLDGVCCPSPDLMFFPSGVRLKGEQRSVSEPR